MPAFRSSTVGEVPDDPAGEAAADVVLEILQGATVWLDYAPADGDEPALVASLPDLGPGRARATGAGPTGWRLTLTIGLNERIPLSASPERTPLLTMLDALPTAALRAAERFRPATVDDRRGLAPTLARALRDLVVVELLAHLDAHPVPAAPGTIAGIPERAPVDAGAPEDPAEAVALEVMTHLMEDTVEFLVELGGTRVESHDLTHGVVITDVLRDKPRLRFAYPADLESAKRGPLLFDGQRAVLIVDRRGRARTELQRHHFEHLAPTTTTPAIGLDLADAGSLVAAATRALGGIGFFLRDDHTIWVFLDGRPLLVRRAEHWSAFPLELAASIDALIGGGEAAELVVQTAFVIAAQRRGAILAIVDDAAVLDGIVSPKDRYDLRDRFDPEGTWVETRLHHLIDASELDPQTLARLATLDGATVVDRAGALLAYGAIVATADSEHEGARTAAAKTLSESAAVVLKVSVDGDVTVFHRGRPIATLLGQPSEGS